jgi:site-specific DNA-methyltransferase (adenine-specific)
MINITNEDNMKLMARYPDDYFDLAIVDPPYGIDIAKWDASDMKPSNTYFKELFRVSENQIIWGANYFHLPHSESWICWHKLKGLNKGLGTMSEFELAWTSHNNKAKYLGYTYLGNTEGFNKPTPNYKIGKRIHPTQKPVKLYEWLLMNYAKEGDKIVDTHIGSASIALACHNLKYDLTGCELDKEYYNAAMLRLKQHQQQLTMF